MNDLTKKENNKLFKKRLQSVHVLIGISFSIIMYISLFFGIFAIVLPYVENWEKPSRHMQIVNMEDIDYSKVIEPFINDPEYPKFNDISIEFPRYNHPHMSINTKFLEVKNINPNTNEDIKIEDMGQSNLARFLNKMHYGSPLREIFMNYIFGFMALAAIFLTFGGLLQVLVIKYKDTGKNAISRFSKWHRKVFIWLFLPFFAIMITGAMMNLGITSMPLIFGATKGDMNIEKLVMPLLNDNKKIEKTNQKAQMLALNDLVKKAKEINPDIIYHRMVLINWQDETAHVRFEGYDPYKPFLNGIRNSPNIVLDAKDASLISKKEAEDAIWFLLVMEAFYFLHFLFGVDIFTRILVAIFMALCTLAVGFGVLMWLEKKAKKIPQDVPVYQGMGKLSLASMIGIIPSVGLLFVLQWLLPFDMEERVTWQIGLFAVFWVGTYTWSFYRINSFQAAKEFLYLGGIFFILSPFIHFFSSGFSPFDLYNGNLTHILSVDISLFIFGSLLLLFAVKLPKNRESANNFWTKIL